MPRRGAWCIRLSVLAIWIASAGPRAQADNISWRNSAGGVFSNAGNWFGGVVPDGNDYAFFGLSSGPFGLPNYTVSFNASATNLGLVIPDDRVTFDLNDNFYQTTQFDAVTIGTTGDAGLTVFDGILFAPFQSEFAVGAVANFTGALTVASGGLVLGDPSLEIGVVGTGILTIQNGGGIIADRTHIGFLENSTGTATISGTLVSVEMFVGNAGTGTLNINTGGETEVNGDTYIGNIAGSTGTTNVNGIGATLDVSDTLNVGYRGTGTLNITNGGRVESNRGVVSARDFSAGVQGSGTVNVAGTNSQWIDTGQGISVGKGSLNVSGGGYVEAKVITLGATLSSLDAGTLNVSGASSMLAIAGDFKIGENGSGNLHITGGRVQNANGFVGAGTLSTVIVEGASSQWINLGDVVIGKDVFGPGSLDIKAGGRVESVSGYIAREQGSEGHVTVDGANGISSWINSGPVIVGGEGDKATLEIKNGGQVQSTTGRVGILSGEVAVVNVAGSNAAGADSQWIMSGDLIMIPGVAELNITDGARVENANAMTGGLVNVSGTNSRWINLGDLVSVFGSTMNITDGGRVENVNGSMADIVVNVSGPGSQWINTATLTLGTFFPSTLNIASGGIVQNTNGLVDSANNDFPQSRDCGWRWFPMD